MPLRVLIFERAAAPVGRHRNATAVGVPVSLVRPDLAHEIEPVAREGCDKFPRGERPQTPVVDGHDL
jgi:hypothetical protein